ncbi:hypothetical protein JCM3765_002824 [Sporobolomyces pararoseus]
MRLNSAVALSLILPLATVHAHNSLRSLNPSHRHLAARRDTTAVDSPQLVTSIDSPLPNDVTPSSNVSTVLVPVDPSTASRVDSALPNPSKSITLYYAEASYTEGAHYRSVIDWTMNWPALVIGDAPQVDSFTCGLDGKILTFNDKDAFEEALEWSFPLVLVTEGTTSGCSFETPDAAVYNPVHLRSIASYDRKSLTINFRGYKSFWQLEASYHDISIGFDPHAERVLNETSSLSKRGVFDPWTYNLLSNMNFNDTSKGALQDSIPIYNGKYEKGPFEGELDVTCKDCYVQGSMIVTVDTGSSIGNAGLNVLAAVVSVADQAVTQAKTALANLGTAAADATKAVLSALGDTAKNIVGSLQSGAAAAIKAGASDIESLYNLATSEIGSAVTSAKSEIGSVLSGVGDVAHDVAEALGDAASTIGEGAQSAIDYVGDKIKDFFSGWWRKRSFMTQEERDAAVDEFFRHLGEELESGAFLNHESQSSSLSRRSSTTGSNLFLEALAESSDIYKSKGDDAVLRKRGMVKHDGTSGYIGLKGGMNASVDVDVTLAGKLTASFNKTLATYGIPELQVPDVVVIGPYLKLEGSVEVGIEGNVTFSTGASLAWNGIDMKVSTSANQNKQTLPMPTYEIHNSTYNVNEIGLKAGVYIEPQVVVGINLIAADQELSGGLGVKFGLENNFKIATDNCSDGVNWSIDVTGEALALYTIPRALSEALGKDDPEQDYSIFETDPIPVYEKCFSLSSKLCSDGQVFSGSKLKCIDNSTETGNSTSTTTTTPIPVGTSTSSSSLATSKTTTTGKVTTTTRATSIRTSSSTSRSTSRSTSSSKTTSGSKTTSVSKPSSTTKKPVSTSTKKPVMSSTKKASSSTTKKASTTTHKSSSAAHTTAKTTTKATSKPHTTGKSTTVKHTTTTTKRVTTTKKPTSTHKPATSTKKPSSSTKKPSSSTKPHSSTSPAHPTHTHKPVTSASLYAGWMIYGDNLTCTPTANIMKCIGQCQSRTGCVGIDWGFRDGAWKCCLKRNIKKFNKEGAGMFHNVVLLDGTCGTHADKLNIPAAMRAVCDPLDVL